MAVSSASRQRHRRPDIHPQRHSRRYARAHERRRRLPARARLRRLLPLLAQQEDAVPVRRGGRLRRAPGSGEAPLQKRHIDRAETENVELKDGRGNSGINEPQPFPIWKRLGLSLFAVCTKGLVQC